MAQLAQAQFTLTDDTDIVISIEPPENATKDMLWLSVGQDPITLYRWSGITGELDWVDEDNESLGYKNINSKTNYFVNYREQDYYTHLIITNPQQPFGIYNLFNTKVDLYGLDDNGQEVLLSADNSQIINDNTVVFYINQAPMTYAQSQNLTFLNSYAAFTEINPVITKIDFTVVSGQLWCPARDEMLSQDISILKTMIQDYDSTRLLSPAGDIILQGITTSVLSLFNNFQLKKGESGIYFTTVNAI